MGSARTTRAAVEQQTHPPARPPATRAQRLIAWSGYLVFGLPAALAIWALAKATTEFGIGETLIGAGPSMLWMELPLIAWAVYCVRGVQGRWANLLWLAALTIISATLLLTPMFFWTGPAFLVLILELARTQMPVRHRVVVTQEST